MGAFVWGVTLAIQEGSSTCGLDILTLAKVSSSQKKCAHWFGKQCATAKLKRLLRHCCFYADCNPVPLNLNSCKKHWFSMESNQFLGRYGTTFCLWWIPKFLFLTGYHLSHDSLRRSQNSRYFGAFCTYIWWSISTRRDPFLNLLSVPHDDLVVNYIVLRSTAKPIQMHSENPPGLSAVGGGSWACLGSAGGICAWPLFESKEIGCEFDMTWYDLEKEPRNNPIVGDSVLQLLQICVGIEMVKEPMI